MDRRFPSWKVMIMYLTGLAVILVCVFGLLMCLPISSSMPMSAKNSMKKAMYGSFWMNSLSMLVTSSLPM